MKLGEDEFEEKDCNGVTVLYSCFGITPDVKYEEMTGVVMEENIFEVKDKDIKQKEMVKVG